MESAPSPSVREIADQYWPTLVKGGFLSADNEWRPSRARGRALARRDQQSRDRIAAAY